MVEINIWKIRTEKEITLTTLARKTGISRSALSNYENGKRYPTLNQLEKIAIALDTTITKLYESPYK